MPTPFTALAAVLFVPAALAAAPLTPARAARPVSSLAVDTAGLAAYYPFDGDFRDASGGGNDARAAGGAKLGDDRFARLASAADLPVGASVSFSRPAALGAKVSIAAWLLLRTGAPAIRPLLTTTGSPKIFQVLFDAGTDELRITNGTGPIRLARVPLPRDRWFHLALVFDAAAATTYVDASVADSFAYTGDVAAGPEIVLGALPTDTRYRWDGLLDDFRLYTRALLPAEVEALASEAMCAASRTLADYAPTLPTVVPIRASVPKTVTSWSVEEEPPATFAVTDVDNGGRFDAARQKVVWGPFTDPSARTLRYTVTPPSGTTGRKSFRGTIVLDGRAATVCGDSQMSSSEVHPADLGGDMTLGSAETGAYAEAWRKGASWSVAPNPIPLTYVTNAGYIWKSGEAYRHDSSVTPPFVPTSTGAPASAAGTAVSSFDPCRYAAGGTVKVTLVVAPPAGAKAWALEESPPAGWTVSDVDNDGVYDATGKKVKWGPLYEAAARTLSYNVKAGAIDSGVRTFSGLLSFDGASAAVTGAREIGSESCGTGYAYWTPAVVHASGAEGSVWQSDLTLLNPGSAAASVDVELTVSGTTESLTRTLAPGTQVGLLDVYSQLVSTDGAGPLRVGSDQPLVVSSRTFNAATAGTLGAAYPVLLADQWLKKGDTAYLPGLREDLTFRTNLGFANGGTEDASLGVTLFDASGLVVTQYLVTLGPRELLQDQQPFYTRGGQTGIVSGFAKLTVQTGANVMAFASVIDNRTNDPTAVAPVK